MAALPDFRPKKTANAALPDFRPEQQRSAPSRSQLAEAADMRRVEAERENRTGLYGKLQDLNEWMGGSELKPEFRTPVAGAGFSRPGKIQSALSGAYDMLTVGAGDEIMSALSAPLKGTTYEEELERNRNATEQEFEENPKSYIGGSIAGALAPAIVTMGGSAPATIGQILTRGAVTGGVQGGIYGFNSGEGGLENRLEEGAAGAALGVPLGLIPGGTVAGYRGLKAVGSKVLHPVSKVFRPTATAEKDLIRRMKLDRNTYNKLAEKETKAGNIPPQRRFLTADDMLAGEAVGQRNMVSDIGGDQSRALLKAASRASSEATDVMRGAAASRQSRQGDRVTDTVSDMYGDTLNPSEITTKLQKTAAKENKARYDAADAHPNAQHLWNSDLQNAASSSFGQKAVKSAIVSSRNEAIKNGEEIVEPVFALDKEGRLQFTGVKTPSGVDVPDVGLKLRFWDQVKREMDQMISVAKRTGANEDVRQMTAIKNNMLRSLDNETKDGTGASLYKKARSGAAEFFGKEDALEMGADYFKNMDSFQVADARKAMQSLSPAERELFSRGYAGQLVTRVSKMGEAEDVNKLFKTPQSRMKMRDALGEENANMMEAFTHREMVHGLLGKSLAAGSDTAANLLANDAMAGGIGAYTGSRTDIGMVGGFFAGIALRHGYKAANRAIVNRYARALAELATSDDPAVIARILSKVSKDPGYMNFSRAVSNAAGSAGTAKQRIEPRIPFARGGLVPQKDTKKALAYLPDTNEIARNSRMHEAMLAAALSDSEAGDGFNDLVRHLSRLKNSNSSTARMQIG